MNRSNGKKKRSKHDEMIEIVKKNAPKILNSHGCEAEYLTIKEFKFPYGRADIVLYGLYGELAVLPVAVEVRGEIFSAMDSLSTINEKMRKIYDYAFTHTYLAIPRIERCNDRKRYVMNLVKNYLFELGYGLLEVDDERKEVEILQKAKPKKPPKRGYYEVASRGILYLAVRKALLNAGFPITHISSEWIGYENPINYCGWISKGNAIFGIYAMGLEATRKLLDSVDIDKLAHKGYRTHIEVRFMAGAKTIGYLHLCDQLLDGKIAKNSIASLMEKIKKYMVNAV